MLMEKYPEIGYYSVYDSLVKRAENELSKTSDWLARVLQEPKLKLSTEGA